MDCTLKITDEQQLYYLIYTFFSTQLNTFLQAYIQNYRREKEGQISIEFLLLILGAI